MQLLRPDAISSSTKRMHIARLAPSRRSFLAGAPPVEWRVAPGSPLMPRRSRKWRRGRRQLRSGARRSGFGWSSIRRSIRRGPVRGTAISSTRAFPCIAPGVAASSPIMGPASASPMSCSTSSAVAPTSAPSSARWSAGDRLARRVRRRRRDPRGPRRRLGRPARQAGGLDGAAAEDKIAALGIRVRRWVSFHGMAVNVAPDLSHFRGIVPCGIAEAHLGVTSLRDLGSRRRWRRSTRRYIRRSRRGSGRRNRCDLETSLRRR